MIKTFNLWDKIQGKYEESRVVLEFNFRIR